MTPARGWYIKSASSVAANCRVTREDAALLQKGGSVRHRYIVDRAIMHDFGATFDDWTILHHMTKIRTFESI